MRNIFLLLALVILFSSCESDDVIDSENKPSYQFDFFSKKNMTFESFYARASSPYYSDTREYTPFTDPEILSLELRKDIIHEKNYHTFVPDGNSTTQYPTLYVNYSFHPIRYEKGNYYEYRGSDTLGIVEVLFLKDNLQIGDTWTSNAEYNTTNGTFTHHHSFELLDIIPLYNEFENVYKVKENLRADKPFGFNIHYYTKEQGIIRRETVGIFNGFYGDIIFNRIN